MAKLLYYHEESGYKNLVVYVCLKEVLVEFSLTRGIYGRDLIRTRLGYYEESGSSSPGDNIGIHEHC